MSQKIISNTLSVSALENNFFADLSNEMDGIACDNSFKTSQAFNIYSQVSAFDGTSDVTSSCEIKYVSRPSNCTTYLDTNGSGTGSTTALTTTFQTIGSYKYIRVHFDGGVTVSKRMTLELQVRYANTMVYNLTMTITATKGGAIYRLVPSNDVVSMNPNTSTYLPASITCYIAKYDVEKGTTSSNPSEATLRYSVDGGNIQDYSSALTPGQHFTQYITFYCLVGGAYVDKETVSVVMGGQNGQPGDPGSPGAEGKGYKLYLVRNGKYSDASWDSWAVIGNSDSWSKDNGDPDFTTCRVGDLFVVAGTSSDSGRHHATTHKCTSVSSNVIQGIVVAHEHDGAKGDTGKRGRFYYFVGTWTDDNTKTYTVNDAQAPFFKYGSSYYVFNPSTNGSYTEHQMGTPSTSTAGWEIMTDDFKYLITEAIFGSFAHFGSFIISGDWLISSKGTQNGSTSYNYLCFDEDYPNTNHYGYYDGNWQYNFIPNVAIDGESGQVYMQNAYLRGTIEGVTGSFKSLKCVNSDGVEKGRICFQAGYDGICFESADLFMQGTYNGRTARFYSANIRCRGALGVDSMATAIIKNNKIRYYYNGLASGNYEEFTLETGTTASSETYYKVYLSAGKSGSSIWNWGEAAGFAVDLLLIDNTSSSYYYQLNASAGKQVKVICVNDNYGAHIAYVGGWIEMSGGDTRPYVYVGSNYTPRQSSRIGDGWFAFENCDNNFG